MKLKSLVLAATIALSTSACYTTLTPTAQEETLSETIWKLEGGTDGMFEKIYSGDASELKRTLPEKTSMRFSGEQSINNAFIQRYYGLAPLERSLHLMEDFLALQTTHKELLNTLEQAGVKIRDATTRRGRVFTQTQEILINGQNSRNLQEQLRRTENNYQNAQQENARLRNQLSRNNNANQALKRTRNEYETLQGRYDTLVREHTQLQETFSNRIRTNPQPSIHARAEDTQKIQEENTRLHGQLASARKTNNTYRNILDERNKQYVQARDSLNHYKYLYENNIQPIVIQQQQGIPEGIRPGTLYLQLDGQYYTFPGIRLLCEEPSISARCIDVADIILDHHRQ
ncbi:MAG: hypothetical protein ACMXYD_04475 [Candidatus Woesearchaeota archaeon]